MDKQSSKIKSRLNKIEILKLKLDEANEIARNIRLDISKLNDEIKDVRREEAPLKKLEKKKRELYAMEQKEMGLTYAQIAAPMRISTKRVTQLIHSAERTLRRDYPSSFSGN